MLRLSITAGATAALVASSLLAATPAALAQGPPPLQLMGTASAVTLSRTEIQTRIPLDVGAFLRAGASPFEIRVTRRSYHDPIVAAQVIRDRGRTWTRPVSTEVVRDFGGFFDFLRLTLTNAAGEQVLEVQQDFCPNGRTVRLRPDAPDASGYPPSCPHNPFALGSVWGIQAGWGTSPVDPYAVVETRGLPDGVYTARLGVTEPYQRAFGIPGDPVTVQVALRTVARPPAAPGDRRTAGGAASRPNGPPVVPDRVRPDLIALPAWAIDVLGDNPGTPQVEPDRLTFAANVWNAGPSPLVVDGFRRPDEAVMDSYQYFYDDRGNQVGYAPVGSMEWDPQPEHHHWHFRDFAGYRLLDSDQHEVTRSQKEAFCLANTDAINLFVKNAAWQPDNTDLHTSCGDEDSVTVRQFLAVGHGDTYPNSAPGRALDIQDLPNGTYYIQVVANPDQVLYERNPGNNTSLRMVILGGVPGARTVRVPPYELIDTDPAPADIDRSMPVRRA